MDILLANGYSYDTRLTAYSKSSKHMCTLCMKTGTRALSYIGVGVMDSLTSYAQQYQNWLAVQDELRYFFNCWRIH